MFVDSQSSSTQAELGSAQHAVFAGALPETDLAIDALEEVHQAQRFFGRYSEQFPEIVHEIRLEIPGLNFGTLDLLGFNEKRNWALVGDVKFGWWPVDEAAKNLQIQNYVCFVFHSYPRVHSVLTLIYHAKSQTFSRHLFRRRSQPKLMTRIREIVEGAQAALKNPQRSDYTPHSVNCSFCARVNCPARMELASNLVSAWTGTQVVLTDFNWLSLTTENLVSLKRLTLVLKKFIECIDEEAKRRVLEGGSLPGYELREKSSPRKIIGTQNIQRAGEVLESLLAEDYPNLTTRLRDVILDHLELSVAAIEAGISRHGPQGKIRILQEKIDAGLRDAKIVDAHPIFSLNAVRE
jgi:hypothetical protein